MPVADMKDPEVQALDDLVGQEVGRPSGRRKARRLLRSIDGRLRTPAQEWGATQAADYLGVRHSNLYKMKGLPEPVREHPSKRWLADDIRRYAESRRD